jgi:hypothetical protein
MNWRLVDLSIVPLLIQIGGLPFSHRIGMNWNDLTCAFICRL